MVYRSWISISDECQEDVTLPSVFGYDPNLILEPISADTSFDSKALIKTRRTCSLCPSKAFQAFNECYMCYNSDIPEAVDTLKDWCDRNETEITLIPHAIPIHASYKKEVTSGIDSQGRQWTKTCIQNSEESSDDSSSEPECTVEYDDAPKNEHFGDDDPVLFSRLLSTVPNNSTSSNTSSSNSSSSDRMVNPFHFFFTIGITYFSFLSIN